MYAMFMVETQRPVARDERLNSSSYFIHSLHAATHRRTWGDMLGYSGKDCVKW